MEYNEMKCILSNFTLLHPILNNFLMYIYLHMLKNVK